MTTVDIHCHNFNADDLPVNGFVRYFAFHDSPLTDDLARMVDLICRERPSASKPRTASSTPC